MKRMNWRCLAATLLTLILLFTTVTPVFAAKKEDKIPSTIRSSYTVTEDMTLPEGQTVTVKKNGVLTVPKGVTLTVPKGSAIVEEGNTDVKGIIRFETGSRYSRMENGKLQETIGPKEDVGTDHTPLIMVKTGPIEVTNGEIRFCHNAFTEIARSGSVPANEVWTMETESEIKYGNSVKLNVPITGPDVKKDRRAISRLIVGLGAKNNKMDSFIPLATYYWLYDFDHPEKEQGFWQLFNGITATGDTTGTKFETWSDDIHHTSRQLEPELTEEEGTVYKDLVYTTSRKTANQYNLYIPRNASKEKPVGLILFIHGGSWTSGGRADYDYACARYTRQGYITATLDYRLFGAETDPAHSMDDILNDIKQCINSIYKKTKSLGYTVTKMATSGYSAGGHLALLYAYSMPNAAKIPVKMVFEQVGPADFHQYAWEPGMISLDLVYNYYLPQYIEGFKDMTADEKETAINHVSPIYYVNKDTVPTVSAYAAEDVIVGYEGGAALNRKLTECGVDHVFLTLEKSNHSSEFDSDVVDQYFATASQYLAKYVR